VQIVGNAGQGRPGDRPGTVDYRLDRRRLLRQFRQGDVAQEDICDAQSELMRVAHHASVPARGSCPVCESADLRNVRFVFGPRLPGGGRCVASVAELERLARRSGEHRCFLVEVCPDCRWNHLLSSYVLEPSRSA
jgi:hypothetical protein